jgi:hypothetical protein
VNAGGLGEKQLGHAAARERLHELVATRASQVVRRSIASFHLLFLDIWARDSASTVALYPAATPLPPWAAAQHLNSRISRGRRRRRV